MVTSLFSTKYHILGTIRGTVAISVLAFCWYHTVHRTLLPLEPKVFKTVYITVLFIRSV